MTSTAPVASPTQLPRLTLTLRTRATNTPTPSPVPQTTSTPQSEPAAPAQVYVVRPGDTLLGIALDMGVSVDQIRSANPNIDPLALQVGQQILVPPPGVAVAAAATPIPLQLEPPTCYELITGSVLCLGEVSNRSDTPASDVRVRVRLTDEGGALLAERTTGIEQALIPPGQSAPYSAIFDSSDSLTADAALLMASPATGKRWVALRIREVQVEQDGSRCRVTAVVESDSGTATGPPRIVLTVYDADDHVVGFRVVNGTTALQAGEQQSIQIEAFSLGSSGPLTCHLYAEAHQL